MLRFLKVFTDKKNQRVLRKEMSKLEEELTEVKYKLEYHRHDDGEYGE